MGFTFKAYQKGRKDRANKGLAFDGAPTLKAGPKSANGPKGGSNKTKVTLNTKIKSAGKTKPKAPKVTKHSLSPDNKKGYWQAGKYINYPIGKTPISSTPAGVSAKANNAGKKQKLKSSRVNYKQLRTIK